MKRYVKNILVGIDQLANAILGGDPDETISSRVGKAALRGGLVWLAVLIDLIFGEGHCQRAIEADEGRNEAWKWSQK